MTVESVMMGKVVLAILVVRVIKERCIIMLSVVLVMTIMMVMMTLAVVM